MDFLSTNLSNAISKVSAEILEPLMKDLNYDNSDIDLLYEETREKITKFFVSNASLFVSHLYKKGLASTDVETKEILQLL
jgi:hypothetical protein